MVNAKSALYVVFGTIVVSLIWVAILAALGTVITLPFSPWWALIVSFPVFCMLCIVTARKESK